MGLHTGGDLKKLTEAQLTKHFGKSGRFFYKIVRGIDDREVQPHRETKSVGAEDTFAHDLTTLPEMNAELDKIAVTIHDRLKRYGLKGRTITVKIKYHDFKLATRSQSFVDFFDDEEIIANTAKNLLAAVEPEDKKIRLLGISMSNFSEATIKPKREERDQLSLGL
jgi:DNA polymerase-4